MHLKSPICGELSLPMIAFGGSVPERRSERSLLILVIDDDEVSRELLTLLLEVEGFVVVSAASGDVGLSQLRGMDPKPEVVLTDLQMPGISGTELATALSASLPAGVPVIAMSGSDSRPPGTPAGAPAGFDGFLLKPFSVADLREAIDGVGQNQVPDLSAESTQAVSSEGQNVAAINEDIFGKLQELMPSAQLGQMYELCIADARTRLIAMRALQKAGDDEGYRREAHAIKGGAGMIGAAEMYDLAATGERDGLGGSAGTSGVTAVLDQLLGASERLERILVERLRG
jgi:CheY-like chemotaxis protein/HPt (histidine-containing phosphotransfer) domain-containing protein